jgi:transposase InsO family protein
MKTHYTAKEIADAVGITKMTVLRMAEKLRLCCETECVLGGQQYLYPFESLPYPWRAALMAEAANVSAKFVPEDEVKDENELAALFQAYVHAPDYNKKRAEARHNILLACGSWLVAGGKKEEVASRRSQVAGKKEIGGADFACGSWLVAGGKKEEVASRKQENSCPGPAACDLRPISKSALEAEFVELYRERRLPEIEPWVYMTEESFSVGTLRRWRAAFKKYGLAGLLTGYGRTKGEVRAVTPEMRMYLSGRIAETPHIRSSTLVKLVEKKYGDRAPDRSTIYRFLKQWKEDNKELFALMKDPSEWKNTFQPAFGSRSINVPYAGHTWELDSTPADVMTLDGKRCAIIGNIDVYSRRAKVVVAETSKSDAIAAVMRKGIIDWGVPKVIRKDNGADYVSKHITACVTGLGIETPYIPPYAPEYKPHIERFFGTMTVQLEELLPGYVGHSVADRKAIEARRTWGEKIMARTKGGKPKYEVVEVPLDMRALELLIEQWIVVYEDTTHHGKTMKGVTPRQRWDACMRRPVKFEDVRVLDILLSKIEERMVHKDGIHLNNGCFIAPELIDSELIGEWVKVRLDAADAGLIYVFTMEGTFVCTATDEALRGQTLSDYMAAKKRGLRKKKEKIRALETISRNEPEPYTVLLDTGEIVRADTGEIIKEVASRKSQVAGKKEIDGADFAGGSRLVAGGNKEEVASRRQEEEGGEGRKVVPYQGRADSLEIREAAKVFESPKPARGEADELMGEVIPFPDRKKETSEWEKPPEELCENALLLYDWYQRKEKAMGFLTDEDRDYMAFLHNAYPDEINMMLRLKGEKR